MHPGKDEKGSPAKASSSVGQNHMKDIRKKSLIDYIVDKGRQ